MGIEPTSSAWEAEVLPLNYTRRMLGCPAILQSDGVTSHGRVVEEWVPGRFVQYLHKKAGLTGLQVLPPDLRLTERYMGNKPFHFC